MIPVTVPATEMTRHEGCAGFDQSPSQQGGLAPRVAAVPIAQSVVFLADVERCTSTLASDHVKSLRIKAVHGIDHAAFICVSVQLIKMALQRPPIFQSIDRQLGRQIQVLHFKGGRVGISLSLEGIMFDAQVVATEIAGADADAHGIRNGDAGGHARQACAGHASGDGAKERILAVLHSAADAASTSQHPVTTCEVISRVVVYRTYHGELVRDLCLQRKHFAEVDARHVGAGGAARYRRNPGGHPVWDHRCRADWDRRPARSEMTDVFFLAFPDASPGSQQRRKAQRSHPGYACL